VGPLLDNVCVFHIEDLFFAPDSQPILASASSAGHIALWDLNAGGRLLHIIRGAHDGAVSAVEWVPGQPVLISSGEDNSVKVNLWPLWCPLQAVALVLTQFSGTAMALRLANRRTASAEVPHWPSCAPSSYTILW
jgi:WD40 repeat protein